jgi:hypothetical protein
MLTSSSFLIIPPYITKCNFNFPEDASHSDSQQLWNLMIPSMFITACYWLGESNQNLTSYFLNINFNINPFLCLSYLSGLFPWGVQVKILYAFLVTHSLHAQKYISGTRYGALDPPFLTSALDWNEWLASRSGSFNREQNSLPCALYRWSDGLQSRSGNCGQ